jgi:Domain of unknown function (DUF4333)
MSSAGPPDAQTGVAPSGRRGRRGYWVPGLIAMAVLLVIAVAVGAGDLDHSAPRVLDGADIASQIGLGIQTQRGAATAPAVHCPKSEPVRSGWKFECSLQQAGKTVPVQVVELDQHGQLSWHIGT